MRYSESVFLRYWTAVTRSTSLVQMWASENVPWFGVEFASAIVSCCETLKFGRMRVVWMQLSDGTQLLASGPESKALRMIRTQTNHSQNWMYCLCSIPKANSIHQSLWLVSATSTLVWIVQFACPLNWSFCEFVTLLAIFDRCLFGFRLIVGHPIVSFILIAYWNLR